MGVNISVNLPITSQGCARRSTATIATQTEVAETPQPIRDLSWAPPGYTVSFSVAPGYSFRRGETLPDSIRVYVVYKTNLPYNIEGIHWGDSTTAYKGLKGLAGWGGLRKWKRLTATTVDLLIVEALEGDETLPEPLVWYRWQ